LTISRELTSGEPLQISIKPFALSVAQLNKIDDVTAQAELRSESIAPFKLDASACTPRAAK